MFYTPVLRPRTTLSRPSFNRDFESFFSRVVDAQGPQAQEDEKAWTVTMDVPGIAREDLTINVEGPVVRIETRKEAARQYKAAYELPQDIDADATNAKLENGVLTLSLGKKQPESRARQIPLN